jgi:hypothetical protein
MSLEQAILEAVRALPAEKQQEVLCHAARLRADAAKKRPFKSVKGCLLAPLDQAVGANDLVDHLGWIYRVDPQFR